MFAITPYPLSRTEPLELIEISYDGTIVRTIEVPDSINIIHYDHGRTLFLRADLSGRIHLVSGPYSAPLTWEPRPGWHVRTYDTRTDTWDAYDLDQLPTESVYEPEFLPTLDDQQLLWWGRAPMSIYEHQVLALGPGGALVREGETLWEALEVGPDGWMYGFLYDRESFHLDTVFRIGVLDPITYEPIAECAHHFYDRWDPWPGEPNPPIPPPLHLLDSDNTFVTTRHIMLPDGSIQTYLEWWDLCSYELVRQRPLSFHGGVLDVGRDGMVLLSRTETGSGLETPFLVALGPDGEEYDLSAVRGDDLKAVFVDAVIR